MKNLVNYETKSEFENDKSLLQTYEDYAALTEDEQKVYLKEEEPYFIVNVSGGTANINIKTQNGEYSTLVLNEGSNKVIAPYGFNFYGCGLQKNIISFDFNNYNIFNEIEFIEYMFYGCANVTELNLNFLNTSKVSSMKYMFYNCQSLTSLNLSNFDCSNVDNMSYMFAYCQNLTSLDLSKFKPIQQNNVFRMFLGSDNINYIKCSQSFKDFCIANISLPPQMREGGSGTWDIVA